jgi:hypothetical protein
MGRGFARSRQVALGVVIMSFHFRLRERAFDRRVAVAIPRVTMQAAPQVAAVPDLGWVGGGYTSKCHPGDRTHNPPNPDPSNFPTWLDMRLIVLARSASEPQVAEEPPRRGRPACDLRPMGISESNRRPVHYKRCRRPFRAAHSRVCPVNPNPGDQSDQRPRSHRAHAHLRWSGSRRRDLNPEPPDHKEGAIHLNRPLPATMVTSPPHEGSRSLPVTPFRVTNDVTPPRRPWRHGVSCPALPTPRRTEFALPARIVHLTGRDYRLGQRGAPAAPEAAKAAPDQSQRARGRCTPRVSSTRQR